MLFWGWVPFFVERSSRRVGWNVGIVFCAICTFPPTVVSGDAVELFGESGARCLEPFCCVDIADGGGDSLKRFDGHTGAQVLVWLGEREQLFERGEPVLVDGLSPALGVDGGHGLRRGAVVDLELALQDVPCGRPAPARTSHTLPPAAWSAPGSNPSCTPHTGAADPWPDASAWGTGDGTADVPPTRRSPRARCPRTAQTPKPEKCFDLRQTKLSLPSTRITILSLLQNTPSGSSPVGQGWKLTKPP